MAAVPSAVGSIDQAAPPATGARAVVGGALLGAGAAPAASQRLPAANKRLHPPVRASVRMTAPRSRTRAAGRPPA
jgi:hypothetical protein